ncbi:MAG: hypothetical protein ACP5KX_07860, partial [Caldisericia bacterium]
MRKILAILLVTLMALSFIPFRSNKIVSAYDKTPATMIANAIQSAKVLVNRPSPQADDYTLVNNGNVIVQRKFNFSVDDLLYWWAVLPNPDPNQPTLLATDMFLTVKSEGSLSKLYDRYYVLISPYEPLVANCGGGTFAPNDTLVEDTKLRFVDVNGDGDFQPYGEYLYYDSDDNKKVSVGDYRYLPYKNLPGCSSVVSGNSDVDLPLTDNPGYITYDSTVNPDPTKAPIFLDLNYNGKLDGNEVYIDPDTRFDVPASFWINPNPWNNTMGPFYFGEVVTITTGPAAGRVFQLGWADMTISDANHVVLKAKNGNLDAGDLFLFFEVLRASCCGNEKVYDISVESDVEPVCWPNPLPKPTKAVAALGPGTGNDFSIPPRTLAYSTAYLISTTTFFNIKLTNREYLDLEIFRDDGVNNNGAGACISQNLSDDYNALNAGEEFIGAVDNDGLAPVTSTGSNIDLGYIIDTLSGNRVYVYDNDGPLNDTYTANDKIVTATRAGWYREVGTVTAGDINLNNPLTKVYAPTIGFITLQGVTFYGPMNNWIIENPVNGITMTYGDFRGMDILVLPGDLNLDVKIETEKGVEVTELKVEQTYTVWISLPEDCSLGANQRVLVTVKLPGELITTGILTSTNRTLKIDNVTPWRGSLGKDMKHHTPMFEVEAFAEICDAIGPDNDNGKYGWYYWSYSFVFPKLDQSGWSGYDCYYYNKWVINPEDLIVEPNKDCISPLDQRWPNIGFNIYNNDNPEDVDDPKGYIIDSAETQSVNLFAYVNASGVGIKYLMVGKGYDDKLYIIQVNTDGSIWIWSWNDDGDGVYELGEVTEQPEIKTGPYVLDEKWSLYKDGIPSPGSWEILGLNKDGILGNNEFLVYDYPLKTNIYPDGMIYALVKPESGCGEVEFTVFTTEVLYNFLGPRPPNYILDPNYTLIDYLGKVKVEVAKLYDLNFAEFEIVDEGLKHSKFYNPYPPYGDPTKGYDVNGVATNNQSPWELRNYWMELRSYPGGQTNLPGSGFGNDYQGYYLAQNANPGFGPIDAFGVVGLTNGFNARHAQFRDVFWKLG